MSLFTNEEQEQIVSAIANAEKATSGEIRIALEKHCAGETTERAINFFHDLGMEKTKHRNGVLIYLAYHDHKFAIIGDKGINKVVSSDFWETTKVAMSAHFASNKIAEGIIAGISLAGEKLAIHFPHQLDDVNELPNDIIYIDQSETNL